jgi:hypothetical protein
MRWRRGAWFGEWLRGRFGNVVWLMIMVEIRAVKYMNAKYNSIHPK